MARLHMVEPMLESLQLTAGHLTRSAVTDAAVALARQFAILNVEFLILPFKLKTQRGVNVAPRTVSV